MRLTKQQLKAQLEAQISALRSENEDLRSKLTYSAVDTTANLPKCGRCLGSGKFGLGHGVIERCFACKGKGYLEVSDIERNAKYAEQRTGH